MHYQVAWIHIYIYILGYHTFLYSRKEAAVPFEVCCLNGSGGRHRSCWRHAVAAGHRRGGEGKAAAVDGWRWETQRSGWDGFLHRILFFVSSRCLNDFLLCPATDLKIYLCFAVNKGCFGRWRRCSAIGSRLERSGGSVVGFQAVSVLLFIFFCQSFAHDFLRPQRFLHTNSWTLWNKGTTKRTTSPGEYCDSCSLVGHAWTACSSPHSPQLFSARLPCGKGPKRSGKILSIGGHVEVQDFCSSKGNRLNRLFHTVTISKYWHEKLRKHTSKWSESLNQYQMINSSIFPWRHMWFHVVSTVASLRMGRSCALG